MAVEILLTDRFEGHALSWLKSKPEFVVRKSATLAPTAEELQNVQGLLIRTGTKIDKELLAKAPHLKVVVSATSGFDHIDLEACREREITAFHCPEGHAQSAAELTWALVMACARKLIPASDRVRRGDWNRSSLVGVELFEKTYGIVGFGRIGRKVARMAQSFEMKVVAYDPYVDPEIFKAHNVECVGYQEVLQLSDVISFHVPLTKETFHMVERNALDAISPHAILVNASRGGVILEQHLVESLMHGVPAAVGLDVFEKEPLEIESPLLRLPNVVLSPHIGSNTQEGFERVSRHAAEKIVAFFKGALVADSLPPQALWYTNPKGFN